MVEAELRQNLSLPKVGVLGLLVTAPTLRRGTVILPAEEETWKERWKEGACRFCHWAWMLELPRSESLASSGPLEGCLEQACFRGEEACSHVPVLFLRTAAFIANGFPINT